MALQIGYGSTGHAGLSPTDQLVALLSKRPCLDNGGRGAEKDIDDMVPPFVQQSGNCPTVHVIEVTSDQEEWLFGQISQNGAKSSLSLPKT